MIIAHSLSFSDVYPFWIDSNGHKSWSRMQGDSYHVTGVDVHGKRFKMVFDNWAYASCVNLYKGSRWLVRGKRRWLINRI